MKRHDPKEFARQVRAFRQREQMTLQELAERIPTSLNTVYRWEAAKSLPKGRLVWKRLQELGVVRA